MNEGGRSEGRMKDALEGEWRKPRLLECIFRISREFEEGPVAARSPVLYLKQLRGVCVCARVDFLRFIFL